MSTNNLNEPLPGQPCPVCGKKLVSCHPWESEPSECAPTCRSCGWLSDFHHRACDVCATPELKTDEDSVERQGRPPGWALIARADPLHTDDAVEYFIVICPTCLPRVRAWEPIAS
jgi:hypothetical protein